MRASTPLNDPASTPGDVWSASFPQPFGRYTLLGRIGTGGMADALLAMFDGPMGFRKPAVVKRMHASLGRDGHFVKMFLDEARLASRLNHPRVVATSEVGECDGHYFIAMEHLEGVSLDACARRYLTGGRSVPLGLLLRVLCDCLEGLHYAHELRDYDGTHLGVVHRDVTPSNLFITAGGAAKVLDFGIAKAATQDEATRTGMLKGKLGYMAPEQFLAAPIDRRADLWSMGVVVWEMATGRRLFKAANEAQTYKNIAGADIPPLATWRVDAPSALDAVIARALARAPGDRYPTAEAMRVDLEAVLRDALGATSHADVAAVLRDTFGDSLEATRRMIREFSSEGRRPGGLARGEVDTVPEPSPGDVSAFVPQASAEPDDDPFALRSSGPPRRPLTAAAPAVVRPPTVPAAPISFVPPAAPPRSESAVETEVDFRLPDAYVAAAQAAVRRPPTAPGPAFPAPSPPPVTPVPPPVTSLPAPPVTPLPASPFGAPPPHAAPPRQHPAVTALGWLTLLALLAAVAALGWSQRDFVTRAARALIEGRPPDPARVGTFQLRLVSDPAGAHVFEGASDLGPTPIELPVLRGAVADAPRRFEFRLPGYATAAVQQGTTLDPRVELRVALTPDRPAGARR